MMKAMAAALCLSAGAAAAAPKVAVDIGPVHAVAARVMAGVGAPDLVVRPGASPHGYSLRPSEARALSGADLVFWVGPSLTPWLADALETLAPDARRVALADVEGATLLPVRADAAFGAYDHDHGGHGHDAAARSDDHGHGGHGDDHAHGDHAHDEHAHDDHAHDEHAHDDHAHDDHAHDDHAHGDHAEAASRDPASIDAHLWLDPANAAVWAGAMAEALAAADPDNAATYRANAAEARAEYAALADEIAAALAPVADRPFLVFHDAYQYFEARFGVSAVGAVAVSDVAAPGAARVAEARAVVRESGAVCVFSEPQFEPALVTTVIEGSAARTGVLDPVGAGIEPGPDLYPALMRRLAADLLACLAESG